MPVEHWWKYLSSPEDDCHGALLDVARTATVSLTAIIYAWTLADLATLFIEAHKRGLAVGVVADRSQSASIRQHAILLGLVDAGVPVTISTSPTGRIMHDKILLRDVGPQGALAPGACAAFGSFNFSGTAGVPLSGAQGQSNVLEVCNSLELCAKFYATYERLQIYGGKHCHQIVPTPPAEKEAP